jgi:hypothetical protein
VPLPLWVTDGGDMLPAQKRQLQVRLALPCRPARPCVRPGRPGIVIGPRRCSVREIVSERLLIYFLRPQRLTLSFLASLTGPL